MEFADTWEMDRVRKRQRETATCPLVTFDPRCCFGIEHPGGLLSNRKTLHTVIRWEAASIVLRILAFTCRAIKPLTPLTGNEDRVDISLMCYFVERTKHIWYFDYSLYKIMETGEARHSGAIVYGD